MHYEPLIQFPLCPLGDELLQQWLVFSHSTRNQCHGGNGGTECQIAGVSGSPSDLLPDPSLEEEVISGGWRRVGSQVSKVRPLNSWFPVKIMHCVKNPAALYFHFLLPERTQCKECKNSPENRLSGFLKELSWGSKQHSDTEDEVMTDGISGAWHNSPIWWSYPTLHER